MHVVIIGTGYVGLVSGACLADFGHEVTCIDRDKAKIERLKKGVIPIYEPGLEALVNNNMKTGKLTFTTRTDIAVGRADIIFIAVETPARQGDGRADLSCVYAAAAELAQHIKSYCVVINKSTVPIGTADEVEAIMQKTNPEADFDVASNPEFLREGTAVRDFKCPDRIIVGADTERAIARLKTLYHPLCLDKPPLLCTNRRTAELIKYAANAFLALKIGFINQVADLCEAAKADVQQVARGIGLDKRIGSEFLNAGPGYGGSCLPKDTLALSRIAHDFSAPMTIIDAVIAANDQRKEAMARRITDALRGDIKGKTVAVLGLTFKPETDDMREAPSLVIIPGLQQQGANVRAYDPQGMKTAKHLLKDVDYCQNAYECMQGADAVVILTEWNEFRELDKTYMKSLLNQPVLIDLRNTYALEEIETFDYHSIGRPAA